MYSISKIPNFNFLDDTTIGGPALPITSELNPLITSRMRWLLRSWRSVLYLPNGKFVTKVKLHQQMQPLLADPASTASDVYVVTQSESIGNIAIWLLYHWSLYAQGVFYHLSALDFLRESVEKVKMLLSLKM